MRLKNASKIWTIIDLSNDKVEFEFHTASNAPCLRDTCYHVGVVERWEEESPMESRDVDVFITCSIKIKT